MILNVFLAFLLKTFAVSVAVSASFFILENGENSDERFSVTEGLLACDRDKSCEQVQYNIDTKDFKLVDNVDVAAKTAKTNGISWTKVQGAYKSCKDALPLHINESEYRIKHINMFSPAIVRCKRNEGRITASFDHNSEDRIKLNGFEAPGSYRHEIKYKSKLEDIIAFVDSSSACKQFTKIDCYHMQITDVGYLIDRRGNQMAYIGGGPVKGHGCQCGITNDCAKRYDLCNCDANDLTWRFDEGYVTDKARLPLTQVRLGDTGETKEQGAHTIGKLICEEQ